MATPDWLQMVLGGNNKSVAGLLDGPASPFSPAVGGSQQVPVAGTSVLSAAAPPQDPVASLLQAYAKYRNASGREAAPAGAELVKPTSLDPTLGKAASIAFRNQTSNPRAGQVFQTFKLGGQTYHVYVDPKTGRRQVFRLPGGGASVAAVGGIAAP